MCSAVPSPPDGLSHRRLGEQLDLFSFDPRAPGAPYWHGRGLAVIESLAGLWRELSAEGGFEEVRTPLLHDADLWRRSGHRDKFADGMYRLEADGRELALKPMSCPAHIALYQRRPRTAAVRRRSTPSTCATLSCRRWRSYATSAISSS